MRQLGTSRRFQLPQALAEPAKRRLAQKLTPFRAVLATSGAFSGCSAVINEGSYVEVRTSRLYISPCVIFDTPPPLSLSSFLSSRQLCLQKLSDMDRHVANGEVLGVSLLLEDIMEQETAEARDADPLVRCVCVCLLFCSLLFCLPRFILNYYIPCLFIIIIIIIYPPPPHITLGQGQDDARFSARVD